MSLPVTTIPNAAEGVAGFTSASVMLFPAAPASTAVTSMSLLAPASDVERDAAVNTERSVSCNLTTAPADSEAIDVERIATLRIRIRTFLARKSQRIV